MIGNGSCAALYFSFSANQQLVYLAQCFRYVAALAVEDRAVGIFKFYIMMVKDFTIIFSFAHLAAAHALGPYGVASFKPVHHINVVNVLFVDMIAAQPVEVIPVAHLVLHFGRSEEHTSELQSRQYL